MGVGGLCLAPTALLLGKTRYILYRRLGGPQAGTYCIGGWVGPRAGTYCIGGWVGPRAGLDGYPHRDSIPGPSSS
jgi:hypothetical protein